MVVALMDYNISLTDFWNLTFYEFNLCVERYQFNLKTNMLANRNSTLNAIANVFSKSKKEIPLFPEEEEKEEEKEERLIEQRKELFGE